MSTTKDETQHVGADPARDHFEIANGSRFLSHFQIDRAVQTIRIRIVTLTPSAMQREFQRDEAQANHERVFAEAQEPVAERLRTGVRGDPRARLGRVAPRGHGAAEQRD